VAAVGNGVFWTLDSPDVRVRGECTAKVGEKPEVTLTDPLVSDPPFSGGFKPGDLAAALKAHADHSVAVFQPIIIQGQLDSGHPVTLINAQKYRGLEYTQYRSHFAVVGENVSGFDQLYSAVRFRIDDAWWLGHLTDGESSVVEDDGSTLTVESADDGNWLVYESAHPTTLQQMEIRVVSGCLALVYLALCPENDLVTRDTQVRIESNSPWLAVYGPSFCGEPSSARLDTLLPRTELTIERFAKWIPINDQLDGLAWAIAKPLNTVVNVEVQVLTSIVEGLHRRLFEQQWYFSTLSKTVRKKALSQIREAARDAAAARAELADIDGMDPEKVYELVEKAVGHVGDLSYQDRAKAVVAEVVNAVAEIAESVTRLPWRLTDPRHSFAHQLPQSERKEPFDVRLRRWTVIAYVTRWLLRVILLLRAGVDPTVLHEKFLEFDRFAFVRANIAQLVRELGWQLPTDQDWRDVTQPDLPDAPVSVSHFERIVAADEAVNDAEADLSGAVAAARAAGDTWTAIGAALGISRQVAQRRFGK
jgi:hypothetical protein